MTDNAKSPILSKNVSSSIGLEPNLRFSEFDALWNKIPFRELVSEYNNKTRVEDEDVLLSSAIDGVFLNSELFGHQRGSSNIGYKKISMYTLILSTQNLHLGNANVNTRFEHGMVSPAYKTYEIRNCNKQLFSLWIKSEKAKRFFYNATTVGASQCRRNVEWDSLYEQEMILPSLAEQQKIADFLSLVDQRIEKQRQLVEVLKRYKRGLFLLLFDGKQQNNILSQIIEYGKAGGTPTSTNKNYYSGTIPFLSISDMTAQGKFLRNTEKHISELGLKNSTAWLVPANSLIISMYASYGLVSINTIPITTSQAMFSIIPKDETDTEYLYYYLSYLSTTGYYDKMVSTGTQANLNAEKVKNIPIYFPSKEERTKIKVILKTFDEMEDAENRKLETLLDIKSGLLQQMFI